MKKNLILIGMVCASLTALAQDSVIFDLGGRSKVIFAVEPEDLETLKQYNFQELMY